MAVNNGLPGWALKFAALVLIVVGFLLLASSYRYGYTGTTIGGGVLLVFGLALLIGKIAARNRGKTP